MPQIHGSLTNDEFIAFDKLAKERGISRSELVSESCRKTLREVKNETG